MSADTTLNKGEVVIKLFLSLLYLEGLQRQSDSYHDIQEGPQVLAARGLTVLLKMG